MTLAHMGGWTGGAWMLLSIFLALIVVGIALALSRLVAVHPTGRAEQILAERLARGEIDLEEHQALRATLGPPPRGTSLLSPIALALAVSGLIGALVVSAVAPGPGHGFMHMMSGMGGMGSMMMGGDAGRSGSPPVSGAREIRIDGSEFSFEPHDVRLRAGETVNIVFENQGMMFHTLTVGSLDLDLRANSGDSISGSLRAETPGTYPFVCTVRGHAEAGMRGTFEVK